MSSNPIYKRRITNRDSFIERATEIHGDLYDYSDVVYEKSTLKVKIKCPEHGTFLQSPGHHVRLEQGCPTCATSKRTTTRDEFIKKARQVHGDRYDYSQVEYKNNAEKVVIVCRDHGEFKQVPNLHTSQSSGCLDCAHERIRDTREVFIRRSMEIYGDRFDYSDVVYVNSQTHVKIYCKKHKEHFNQIPSSHYIYTGCKTCKSEECARPNKLTTEEFIRRAKEIHGDVYNYDNVEYAGNSTPVEITCPTHGVFIQYPSIHMKGSECSKCAYIKTGQNRKVRLEDFIKRSKKVHGDKYDYSKTKINGVMNNVVIGCPEHGEFNQLPSNHMRGAGCLQCAIMRSSTIQILTPEFLDRPAILYHVEFQRPDCTVFEKLGVTTNTITGRFSHIRETGLTMRTLNVIGATLAECIEMEQSLFEVYHDRRYKIHDLKNTRVGGWTECFPPNIVSLFKSYDDEVLFSTEATQEEDQEILL